MNSSNRLLRIAAALIFILPLLAAGWPTRPALANGHMIPGQYIVAIDPSFDPPSAAVEFARAYGIRVGFVYKHALKGFSATIPDALLAPLQRDPRVVSIQPDRVVT